MSIIKFKKLSVILSILTIGITFSIATHASTKQNRQVDKLYIDYGLPFQSCEPM